MTSQIKVGQPGLLRQLGFFSATALVISNMVGTGIFATTGFMAGDLGDPKLILALWVVAAIAFAGFMEHGERMQEQLVFWTASTGVLCLALRQKRSGA